MIKGILKTKKIQTIMLEEDGQAGNIHVYMKERIANCLFMIADYASYKENHDININVIYEMGIANGMNKKTIYIVDESKGFFQSKDVPFDINSHNTIKYDKNNLDEFKNSISKIIDSTLKILDK